MTLLLSVLLFVGASALATPTGDETGAAKVTLSGSGTGSADPEARPVARYRAPRTKEKGLRSPARDASPGQLAIDVFGKLAVVVALIFVCGAVWRRLHVPAAGAPRAQTDLIQVTQTATLAPQRFLHVVAIGEHRLLLASCPQQISLITRLDGPVGPRIPDAEAVVPAAASLSAAPRFELVSGYPPERSGGRGIGVLASSSESASEEGPPAPGSLFRIKAGDGRH
jgi:flagellar biogenesis protein FliO